VHNGCCIKPNVPGIGEAGTHPTLCDHTLHIAVCDAAETLRSWRYQKWRVVRDYIVEVDSRRQHVGRQIDRGLHMVNTIFGRPRPVAFHVYLVPDGNGPVLTPAHLPIRTRCLIEQQCPDRLGPRPSTDPAILPIAPSIRRYGSSAASEQTQTCSLDRKSQYHGLDASQGEGVQRRSVSLRAIAMQSQSICWANLIEQHVHRHATASAMAKDIVLSKLLHPTQRGRGRERGILQRPDEVSGLHSRRARAPAPRNRENE
jgi:hypothetical protein